MHTSFIIALKDKDMIKKMYFFIFCFFFFHQNCFATLASLSKNNPFPLFGTAIFDYVSLKERSVFAPDPYTTRLKDHLTIGISLANQTAHEGKRINGRTFTPSTVMPAPVAGTDVDFTDGYVPLGDLFGRTNLIALLGGPLPADGQTLPTILQAAKDCLDINDTNFNETIIDPQRQFGCNTTELKYSKKSALFDIEALFGRDSHFGGTLRFSIDSIKQNVQQVINQTVPGSTLEGVTTTCETFILTAEKVNNELMHQFHSILAACSQQLTHLAKTTVGQVQVGLFWREYFELNHDTTIWPKLLWRPFLEAQIGYSPDKSHPCVIFKSPSGNNGHFSIGLDGGFLFDFVESVFVSAQGGYTYFFKRDIDKMPIPNNIYQTNFYPFVADVTVKPGGSWYFSGKIGSRHFIDRLSASIEYVIVEHGKDGIDLKKPDPAFFTKRLEENTVFKMKLINLSFTYDVAPTLNFGFTWQTPISIRNGYRASTLIFSVNGLF
jgi:hypothetical protein